MELFILENGRIISDMEEELRFGLMAHSMRGSGKMIAPMAEEDLFILMEISLKAFG